MPPKRRVEEEDADSSSSTESTKKMRRKKGKERAADGTFQGDENLQDPVLSHPAYTKQKEFLDLERSFLLEKKSRLKAALQSLHADEKMLREAGKDAMESREYDSMVWDMIQRHNHDKEEFWNIPISNIPSAVDDDAGGIDSANTTPPGARTPIDAFGDLFGGADLTSRFPAENEGTGALFSVESDDEMWDDDAGDDEEDPGEGFDIDEEW